MYLCDSTTIIRLNCILRTCSYLSFTKSLHSVYFVYVATVCPYVCICVVTLLYVRMYMYINIQYAYLEHVCTYVHMAICVQLHTTQLQ